MKLMDLLGERPVRRLTNIVLLVLLVIAVLTALFEPRGGYEILRGFLTAAGIEITPWSQL